MKMSSTRDLIAFWIFGLANNYGYVIMLSAAVDIISRQDGNNDQLKQANTTNLSVCQEKIVERECNELSTGAVLIADILPCLIIKIISPFFMHRLPFGFRHALVCILQALSFIIVAYSWSIEVSLFGVAIASVGSGFGESCYLALAAHYPKSSVLSWSSGTGGAGIAGALAYATLTEPQLIGLKPRHALLSMLIVPFIFAIAYWSILKQSASIHQMQILKPSTWIVPKYVANKKLEGCDSSLNRPVDSENPVPIESQNFARKSSSQSVNRSKTSLIDSDKCWRKSARIYWILPLLKYMIPLTIVYFAEYLINQGVVELFVFDCSHGFSLSVSSQYRWYQVLYQVGVFISRSSVNIIELSAGALYMLPLLQTFNLILFFFNAIYSFVPHIGLIFALILFEGFFGGASYVNTFNRIHKEVPPETREFCLSVATLSDSVGTVIAGFTAFPLHNYICSLAYL